MQQFKNEFARAGYPEIEIVDPNPKMTDFLYKPIYLNRYPETKVIIEVVSKTTVSKEEIESISPLLQKVSPATAEAFQNYRYDPNLFDAKLIARR